MPGPRPDVHSDHPHEPERRAKGKQPETAPAGEAVEPWEGPPRDKLDD